MAASLLAWTLVQLGPALGGPAVDRAYNLAQFACLGATAKLLKERRDSASDGVALADALRNLGRVVFEASVQVALRGTKNHVGNCDTGDTALACSLPLACF